ncbi:hypothetical protein EV44_g1947 [Erysiphe necator]|uniref:Nucleic acid-binding protein n=1 Tax=Uncinula necator TaxID=52586 RepID=A0A0B1PAD7_UNCNE|nr:hypothetical protein EV44_g1947 [Erysiphe necator]
MTPKIIIFTGAPNTLSLDWDESNLLSYFQPSIAQFCGKETMGLSEVMNVSQPSWRLLSHQRSHYMELDPENFDNSRLSQCDSQEALDNILPIITSKKDLFTQKFPQNLEISESRMSQHDGEIFSQFYEESYIRHKDKILPLSICISEQTSTTNSSINNDDDSSLNSSLDLSLSLVENIPVSDRLTDLKDIPSAGYIDSIYPQTVTCNIIVGIISITEARAIKTRRGQNLELIELLVGDETNSGFKINFWSNSLSSGKKPAESINVLYELKTQDIILIQNMALNSFQGNVYGQNLRKELTKIYLLDRYRNFGLKCTRYNGCVNNSNKIEFQNLQFAKINRVLEWLVRFVKVDPAITRRKEIAQELQTEELPPDTQ